ncbi:hypothetical protein [Massilia alkalitolerans]|uniref:hypothetical protein n=1 Tax=Massilia alkalitolerans TaxID=286638 RepID=UPI0004101B31|nr:hypothetical protein [Massilia alkalitolerans]
MAQVDLYWAEKALGERYVPEDRRWMHTRYRAALLLGGVASALTAGAVLGAIAYRQSTAPPRVALASYQTEALSHRPVPAPLVPASDVPAPAPRPAPVKAVEPPPPTSSPVPTALAAAVPAPKQKLAPRAAEPSPAPRAPASAVKVQEPPKPVKVPEPSKPVKAQPAAALPPAPQENTRSKPQEPVSAPQPAEQVHAQVGLSKAAGSKPTDIASGEKLGIREILPDGIVMQNGRRIKNGTSLPNGELLMGTDAAKGMAETDRRVLVLTP